MAVSFTVSGSTVIGNKRMVWGTLTSASGDTSASLTATTHGLNSIADYKVSLETGGIAAQAPKVAVSSGTLTMTFDDTQGYSGVWSVIGS